MSKSTLPSRCFAAACSVSTEVAPNVAFTTSSSWAAASANVPSPISGCCSRHTGNCGFPYRSGSVLPRVDAGSRVPITTSWPSPASRAAIVCPTLPVQQAAGRGVAAEELARGPRGEEPADEALDARQ